MFLTIQIPFVDLRLLNEQDGSSPFFYPHQFMEKTHKPIYYRHFGSKHYRYNSDGLPKSERSFFDSQDLLKISKISDYKSTLVFSRLFTDELFFHFDIGLRIKAIDKYSEIDLSLILQHLLNENVFIAHKKYMANKNYNLISLRQYVESLYLYATTRINHIDVNPNNYLYFGKTAIFCHSKEDECKTRSIRMKKYFYEDIYDISINKSMIGNALNPIHLWLLERGSDNGETRDLLRRLRICLLKLNNYREGLDGIFQHLFQGNIRYDKLSELLSIKLTQLSKLLERDEYYGVDGKYLMDSMVANENALYYESWEENKQKIKYILSGIESCKKRPLFNIKKVGEFIMTDNRNGDTYYAQQVGIQGSQRGFSATINQVLGSGLGSVEYDKIINEVELLRKHLREIEPSDDNDILIGELAQLNKALEKKDDGKIITIIKSCGSQLLDIAKRIGCSLVASLISGQLGL